MAAAQFHDSFWVAAATAAPVIGLASALTADQVVRRAERAADRAARAGKPLPPIQRGLYVIAYGNMMLQTFALMIALSVLSSRHETAAGRGVISTLEGVGMILVFLPSLLGLNRYGSDESSGDTAAP